MIRKKQSVIPDLTRRETLAGAAALSVAVVLPTPSWAAKETIISTIFGGRFEKEYRKAIADPFQQKHDVEVVLKYGNAGQWLTNALVNRENPSDTTPELTEARGMIEAAERIVFLGFGYDKTNLERLGWPDVVRSDAQIIGTAYRIFGNDLRDAKRNLGLGERPVLYNADCLGLFVKHVPLEK